MKRAVGESVTNPELQSYLDGGVANARRALLQLQVRNRYYAEALDTLALMRLKGDEDGLEVFAELAGLLQSLQESDDAYGVAGRIEDRGSWSISLFKDAFYIDDLQGTVAELKLRCRGSYVFFDFDPETQYEISEGAGKCTLEVIGGTGTTFTLVQH